MRPQLQTEPIPQQQQIPDWSPALRFVFRFSVIYLGLFCLATQIITSLFSATQGNDIPTREHFGRCVHWSSGRPLISFTSRRLCLGKATAPAATSCLDGSWLSAF